MISFFLFLVFGLIVGAVARLIVPGTEPGGWFISMAIGMAASVAGGALGQALGVYHQGESAGFLVSTGLAVVMVSIYHAVRRSSQGGNIG
jgi:uncharacterized membrane protein YeaQ/YmgE (transglycosylase-associated protein family)